MLVLEDGRTFRGEAYGAVGETFGEAVFSTGMTGYQETLTDPSYHRQVVVMTAPHIGNTGVNDEDPESSRIWVAGYVVRDPARRARATGGRTRSLDDELAAQGVVGISGIDTRALTRHLRERGAMRVGISSDGSRRRGAARARPRSAADGRRGAGRRGLARPSRTSSRRSVRSASRVAALDLGIKAMTPRRMAERGIEVHVLPATATLDDVLAIEPDGVFFSNGPGDPATADHAGRAAPRSARARHPVLRHLLRQPAVRPRARLRHLQARATATAASTSRSWTAPPARSRSPRTTTASPSTRRSTGPPRRRTASAEVSHVCLNDDVVEGLELLDHDGRLRRSACSTTPRPRPARTTPATCSTGSST